MSEASWRAILDILQPVCQLRGGGWVRWQQSISDTAQTAIEKAKSRAPSIFDQKRTNRYDEEEAESRCPQCGAPKDLCDAFCLDCLHQGDEHAWDKELWLDHLEQWAEAEARTEENLGKPRILRSDYDPMTDGGWPGTEWEDL